MTHYFGSAYVISTGGMTGGCPTGPTTATDLTADDGSGYFIASITGPGGPYYGGLAAANGAQISAPLQVQTGGGSITDRNGNILSAAASGPTFTDTLGDTVLKISGSGTPASPTVLTYTNPAGGNSSYTVNYTSKTVQTDFGCSGITEYGATAQNLISSISLPDGSSYTFTYETTPGHSPNVTGRLYQVTLPTGGLITYTYSGGSNGITCADGTAATLNRTTPDSSTAWVYAHSESGCASGSAWCTTITDPSGNQTVISFQPDAPSGGQTNGYEVQRKAYQGATTGTLLQTVDTCYNSQAPPCPTVAIGALPPTGTNIRTTPGGYALETYKTTTYNGYALPLDVYEYDYGTSAPFTVLRQTVIAYDTALTNNIVNMPSSVSVYNGIGTLIAQTKYSYDQGSVTPTTNTPQHTTISGSRGNVTTVQYLTSGSTYLTQTYSYYDTGNVNVFTDVNNGQTTYTYGSSTSCGNSFATGVTEAVTTLTQSYAWNCTGGIRTSTTDENSQIWSTGYSDPNYWRPTSTTDPASATTDLYYYTGPFAAESTLNFNGTTSTVDTRATVDGLGRAYWTQRQQQQGLNSYDTVQTTYDAQGRPWKMTVPFTAAAATSTSSNTTAPRTTNTYDTLGRPLTVTDGGGGTTTYNYTQAPGSSPVGFDVLVTVSGGSSFSRQFEYDGLGRLTSVCE
ncbi:MAG TPA: hypothetical protein VN924_24905, partial [Bryobacteraceae bacterium]|nr:hypothetical protein [Bryobacteraceae bacterium]